MRLVNMLSRPLRRPGGFHGVTATSSKYPLGGHAPRSILVANEQEFLNLAHKTPRRQSFARCFAFGDPRLHDGLNNCLITGVSLSATLLYKLPLTSVKRGAGIGMVGGAFGYYRRARWSQIRNPKPETRNKFKCPMFQGQEPPAGWWFWSFPAWCLGLVSGFEFRISGFRALNGGSSKMHPMAGASFSSGCA